MHRLLQVTFVGLLLELSITIQRALQMGVSKNRGKTPKMDGLFHGSNPIFQWMIWGKILPPPILVQQHPILELFLGSVGSKTTTGLGQKKHVYHLESSHYPELPMTCHDFCAKLRVQP